jgi:hypothetical protein
VQRHASVAHLVESWRSTLRCRRRRTRPGRLHTVVGNEPTIALYRSAGWVLTDHVVTSVDYGMVYDEHVLLKTLR